MKTIATLLGLISLLDAHAQDCVDVDGNEYATVPIGNQLWMAENLKTTRYLNGDSLITGLSDADWLLTAEGACAPYQESEWYEDLYGRLYNYFAISDQRGLCPQGWHVPSESEWTMLFLQVGGTSVAGSQLKDTTNLWCAPNNGALDAVGFGARPGGFRHVPSGLFGGICDFSDYWSTTVSSEGYASSPGFHSEDEHVETWPRPFNYGLSCRCISDEGVNGFDERGMRPLHLSPNPTTGPINLLLPTSTRHHASSSVLVTSTLGQPILTLPLNGNQRQTIDLLPYENGVYFVEVRYADGTRAVERIVKQ